MTEGRSAVVLFTRDLRVHDNPLLTEASRTAAQVVPLFVLDGALVEASGANRLAFLVGALADLRTSLRKLGADLVVRRGDPVEEAIRVAEAVGAETVFTGSDASAYAQRREARLEHACRRARIALRMQETIAVVPPGELAPADRDHYRVFTAYWRRWREQPVPAPAEPPARLRLPHALEPGPLPTLADLSARSAAANLPPSGEHAGRRRLDRFLAEGLRDYGRGRDDLAQDGTSRLSPYLHFGCVSAGEVLARADAAGPVAEPFVRQVCWRDFYLQLLAANPATPGDDLHPRPGGWSDDHDSFERWRVGTTGYPIVDAAMRQLHVEGWMHNRARLIAASFLTKTLGIDWRRGARVFSDLLVDGDVASNVGNWQWVAGTGVDTRPGRVFNPIAQAKRLDPAGRYVRRYVTELADLDGATVHEPWRAPLARVAPDYPARIVDYAEATARTASRRSGQRSARA
jgi:deoxyribodipyrimidine photo-lyase